MMMLSLNPIGMLPEALRDGDGLSQTGQWWLLATYALFVMILAVLAAAPFYRRGRAAVLEVERENARDFERMEIYRATVDSQVRRERLSSK